MVWPDRQTSDSFFDGLRFSPSGLAAQMRIFDAHPEQALALLLGSDF